MNISEFKKLVCPECKRDMYLDVFGLFHCMNGHYYRIEKVNSDYEEYNDLVIIAVKVYPISLSDDKRNRIIKNIKR